MRKAALLYNPDSGGSGATAAGIGIRARGLRDGGVEADLVPTDLASTPAKKPAGDRLRLRHDFCLRRRRHHPQHRAGAGEFATSRWRSCPWEPRMPWRMISAFRSHVADAAEAALQAVPRRIALGRVKYADLQGNPGTRYFVVAAGVGVDAHLFYKLHSGTKKRMGMAAYYAKAWNLWFTYPMTRFVAEYIETGSDGSAARRSHRTDRAFAFATSVEWYRSLLPERRWIATICGWSSAAPPAASRISPM